MPDPRAELKTALRDLTRRGLRLQITLIAKAPASVREEVANLFDPPESTTSPQTRAAKDADADNKPNSKAGDDFAAAMKEDFNQAYQLWYSLALPVVQQILPDRYTEFREMNRLDKRPRDLDPATYSISDYIQGIRVTQGFQHQEVFSGWRVAQNKLENQLNILRSAEDRLDSALADITGIVESRLLDDEMTAARALAKNSYLRSAGIVAGVVLERHLKRLMANHGVSSRKKAQIATMNEALKSASVYGVPEWRRIQHLGDLRNLCGHDGERDPTRTDVDELIAGVETVISTVI